MKFLLEHAAAALFFSPGLGKTSIVLSAVSILKKKGILNKVLIVAPLRVCLSVWPNEAKKWRDFAGLRVCVLHGKDKDRLLSADEHDVYVINPEGLDWLTQVKKVKSGTGRVKITLDVRRFKALGFDTLVMDELTKFKNSSSMRFKVMRLIVGTFSRRWGLTGSPAASGLMGLFGQCYVLDEGRSLGQYITQYRKKYFDLGYDGFTWTLKDGAEAEIYERVAPLALQVGDEALEGMPQMIEHDIVVDLPAKTMKVYKAMAEDLIAQIDEGLVSAKNAAVASGKVRQIANGGIYLAPEVEALVRLPSDAKEVVHLHEAKLDALSELVEDLQGSPLLVAYDFGHELERLQKRFPGVPHIGGGVSAKRGLDLEAQWNAGGLPVLFGQLDAVSHGMNLQGAGNHVAFHALPWSFEVYDQYLRRVLRQGNKEGTVYVHRILARDTVDERIVEVLQGRDAGQNAMFKALKARR